MESNVFITIIMLLLGIIGYFLKRIMDTTDAIAEDVKDMKPKVKILWEEIFSATHSPRQLNERGAAILAESGIKTIMNAQKAKLSMLVKERHPSNPYDAEKEIIDVVMHLPEHCPEVIEDLKNGAFRTGVTIEVVLFAGALYLRNEIFSELGFNLDDLDIAS